MEHYALNEELNHKKKVKPCLVYSLEAQGEIHCILEKCTRQKTKQNKKNNKWWEKNEGLKRS